MLTDEHLCAVQHVSINPPLCYRFLRYARCSAAVAADTISCVELSVLCCAQVELRWCSVYSPQKICTVSHAKLADVLSA
jgi:hypothetical protein